MQISSLHRSLDRIAFSHHSDLSEGESIEEMKTKTIVTIVIFLLYVLLSVLCVVLRKERSDYDYFACSYSHACLNFCCEEDSCPEIDENQFNLTELHRNVNVSFTNRNTSHTFNKPWCTNLKLYEKSDWKFDAVSDCER